MSKNPKPSNGSLICTFCDCPDRLEDIRTTREVMQGFDYRHGLCPIRCPQSPRNSDYSKCNHEDVKYNDKIHGCSLGNGEYTPPVELFWCEAALVAGKCPRGFRR